jgi:macrolide transport system ATP-binding/permease protein
MGAARQTTQFRFWLWLICVIGVIVPRRLRADWRQEWEAELRYRERLLAEWDRLDWRNKLELLRRSASAFWDALVLQPQRLEDEMFQDIRFGIRMMLQHKGFTIAAALCLALGIGANTTLFSLVSAVLFRPPVAAEPERLITVSRGRGLASPLSYPDFTALRERNDALIGLAASQHIALSIGKGARNELALGEAVSGNYFDVLGIQPAAGRMFLPEEDRAPGAQPVAVLSHHLWQSRLSGDPDLIGQTIALNGNPFTVIGVATPGVGQSVIPGAVDVWIPAMMLEQVAPGQRGSLQDRRLEQWSAIGRLKPGVSLQQAQAALETINRQIEQANPTPVDRAPDAREDRSLTLLRPQGLTPPHLRRMATMLTVLLGAVVGVVLLIACANVANLLLARASARRKEIAVRLALGASRFRLLRQLLTESFLLALLGAGAGLLLAYWLNRAFMAFKPPMPPPWSILLDLRLDTQVLGWTLSLTFGASLLFGLAPALQASKPDLVPALKDETGADLRRKRRLNLRSGLVVAQVAISLVLLICAGLFVRSLQELQAVNPGFRVENGLTLSIQLEPQGYDETRGEAFMRQLLERAAALPGVQTVSAVNYLPLGHQDLTTGVFAPGRERQVEGAGLQIISLNYFPTMGMPLLRGRDFTAKDTASAPKVTIINETLAARLFPGDDAMGKQLRDPNREGIVYEIIGIAKDSAYRSLGEAPRAVLYRPYAQEYSSTMNLVVRAAGDPQALFSALRREVNSLDANLPTQDLRTLREHVRAALEPVRLGTGVLSLFSLLGLFLAAIGIYGVMSYAVARRTREIGVRMAVGAKKSDVLKLIVRQGLTLALVGAGIGLAIAFAVTRLLAGLLYGVGATDPWTLMSMALFLMAVALIACYLPARRATKIDPLTALRCE